MVCGPAHLPGSRIDPSADAACGMPHIAPSTQPLIARVRLPTVMVAVASPWPDPPDEQ